MVLAAPSVGDGVVTLALSSGNGEGEVSLKEVSLKEVGSGLVSLAASPAQSRITHTAGALRECLQLHPLGQSLQGHALRLAYQWGKEREGGSLPPGLGLGCHLHTRSEAAEPGAFRVAAAAVRCDSAVLMALLPGAPDVMSPDIGEGLASCSSVRPAGGRRTAQHSRASWIRSQRHSLVASLFWYFTCGRVGNQRQQDEHSARDHAQRRHLESVLLLAEEAEMRMILQLKKEHAPRDVFETSTIGVASVTRVQLPATVNSSLCATLRGHWLGNCRG